MSLASSARTGRVPGRKHAVAVALLHSTLVLALFFFVSSTLLPRTLADEDDYDDTGQTVARISYVSGSVSFNRGDDPDNWEDADRNVPMTQGDRIYTDRDGRVELQIHGGYFVRLDSLSDLTALNLGDDSQQFSLTEGVASFQIDRLGADETIEIDTPNAAVNFERTGHYRIDVDEDGNTRVYVRRGRATVSAGGGQVALNSGDQMQIDGVDAPHYDIVGLPAPDRWDHWVQDREDHIAASRSRQYVHPDVTGVEDLDDYGHWESVPQYGTVWTPTAVASDWCPYRAGHWIWQDPWGWTWVASEPWGWAPYHYGRWVVYSSRWFWVPVRSGIAFVSYSPALVVFSGCGPGWSSAVAFGGGAFVGWFPLAPADPSYRWWGSRPTVVNVTKVTYVNKTYITVINQNTFVSGGAVGPAVVRDHRVVRQVVEAPPLRGPVPALPTPGALRGAQRPGASKAPRPPTSILTRAVVTRTAPPPRPPRFEDKLGLIRENRGAPVPPGLAAKLSVEKHGGARAARDVRPVALEGGRMTLVPKRQEGLRAHPQPLASLRNRPMATVERPVAEEPVVGRRPREAGASRDRTPAAPGRGGRPPGREGAGEQGTGAPGSTGGAGGHVEGEGTQTSPRTPRREGESGSSRPVARPAPAGRTPRGGEGSDAQGGGTEAQGESPRPRVQHPPAREDRRAPSADRQEPPPADRGGSATGGESAPGEQRQGESPNRAPRPRETQEPKKDEPKKQEAKGQEQKKEEPKKEEPKAKSDKDPKKDGGK